MERFNNHSVEGTTPTAGSEVARSRIRENSEVFREAPRPTQSPNSHEFGYSPSNCATAKTAGAAVAVVRPRFALRQPSVLPGFGLSMGFTLLYMTLLLFIPLAGLILFTAVRMTPAEFWAKAVVDPRVLASYRLSFGASLIAATLNGVFGLIVAWVLVRYQFPGKRLVDALVDLPFALPTAVSGIALTTLYAHTGWIGRWLDPLGIQIAFAWPGIVIALTLIGLPFVVRTVQPALEDLDQELEEAAASLGATRWQTFRRVILPSILPSLLTGFAMAFARAVGEFGSIYFIAGNMPYKTEIAPLLILIRLEQYDYAGATAIGMVMLVVAFVLLLAINLLQWWSRRFQIRG